MDPTLLPNINIQGRQFLTFNSDDDALIALANLGPPIDPDGADEERAINSNKGIYGLKWWISNTLWLQNMYPHCLLAMLIHLVLFLIYIWNSIISNNIAHDIEKDGVEICNFL